MAALLGSPSLDANLGPIATIAAAIIGAVIAGLFGIFYIRYQAHQNKKLIRENEHIQREKEDIQSRLDAASRHQQFEDDIEKSQYEGWLTARRDAQERERQRKKSARTADKATPLFVKRRTPNSLFVEGAELHEPVRLVASLLPVAFALVSC
jgi:uncharacterized protein YdiU (UPF0061 family)